MRWNVGKCATVCRASRSVSHELLFRRFELRIHLEGLAVADEAELDGVARLLAFDIGQEFFEGFYFLAVDGHDAIGLGGIDRSVLDKAAATRFLAWPAQPRF